MRAKPVVGWLAIGLGIVLMLGMYRSSHGAPGGWSGTADSRAPIDQQVHATLATADFALGCFWGSDARFGGVEGVVHTRCGYCGGTKLHPTYEDLGDHTETVEVDYDPAQVSYAQLLNVYWASHSCTPSTSRQYQTAIFYRDEVQHQAILASKHQREASGHQVFAHILPFTAFTAAEDYHQKYYLRNNPKLMREFMGLCVSDKDFRDSTAAARVNAQLGGHPIRTPLASLGLSADGQQALTPAASAR